MATVLNGQPFRGVSVSPVSCWLSIGMLNAILAAVVSSHSESRVCHRKTPFFSTIAPGCKSMSFRTKLLLVVLLTIFASVSIVAYAVTYYTGSQFEAMDTQRTEALVAQFRKEFSRLSGSSCGHARAHLHQPRSLLPSFFAARRKNRFGPGGTFCSSGRAIAKAAATAGSNDSVVQRPRGRGNLSRHPFARPQQRTLGGLFRRQLAARPCAADPGNSKNFGYCRRGRPFCRFPCQLLDLRPDHQARRGTCRRRPRRGHGKMGHAHRSARNR